MAQELKAYNVVATVDMNPEVVDSLGCTEFAGYDADEVDAVIAEKDADIRKLLIEYNKTIDSNESLRIAATESMRIVERKTIALMKCRRHIAHLNSLLSNSIMGKLKYDRQFGYWNGRIMDEKFKEGV